MLLIKKLKKTLLLKLSFVNKDLREIIYLLKIGLKVLNINEMSKIYEKSRKDQIKSEMY